MLTTNFLTPLSIFTKHLGVLVLLLIVLGHVMAVPTDHLEDEEDDARRLAFELYKRGILKMRLGKRQWGQYTAGKGADGEFTSDNADEGVFEPLPSKRRIRGMRIG
ncbi:hypothetical protein AAHC03_01987 [Spirometra sp. Aus1]